MIKVEDGDTPGTVVVKAVKSQAELDVDILKLSLQVMTKHLNDFLAECVDEQGKPKAPTMRTLMKMRGYLPPQHSMALQKKDK